MLTIDQYLLTKLAEEAAEVAQMAMKTAQFGATEVYQVATNAQRLRNEIFDLLTIVKLLEERKLLDINIQQLHAHETLKRLKIQHYLAYSQGRGITEVEDGWTAASVDPAHAGVSAHPENDDRGAATSA